MLRLLVIIADAVTKIDLLGKPKVLHMGAPSRYDLSAHLIRDFRQKPAGRRALCCLSILVTQNRL